MAQGFSFASYEAKNTTVKKGNICRRRLKDSLLPIELPIFGRVKVAQRRGGGEAISYF